MKPFFFFFYPPHPTQRSGRPPLSAALQGSSPFALPHSDLIVQLRMTCFHLQLPPGSAHLRPPPPLDSYSTLLYMKDNWRGECGRTESSRLPARVLLLLNVFFGSAKWKKSSSRCDVSIKSSHWTFSFFRHLMNLVFAWNLEACH